MDYLTLIQEVAINYGLEKPSDFTAASTEEYYRVLSEINRATEDIFMHKSFKFREKTTTFNTVISQQNYTLPNGVIKTKGIFIPSIRTEALCYDNSQDLKDFISYTDTGTPDKYTVYNNEIWMYPIPDSIVSVTVLYNTHQWAKTAGGTEKTSMTLTDDEPNFPAIFHSLIIYKALFYLFDDDLGKQRSWYERYRNKLRDIKSESNYTEDNSNKYTLRNGFNSRLTNAINAIDRSGRRS